MTRSRKMIWALAILVVGYIGYSSLPDAGAMLSGARDKDAARLVTLEQIALADEALADEEAFLAELETARAAVPADPDLPAVIDALDETIRRVGMRWTSGAPSAQDTGFQETGQGEWQLSMTVSGDVRSLPLLLDALRAQSRLIAVDSVQLRNEGAGVVVQISARFFAFPGDPLAFDTPTDPSADPVVDPSGDGSEVSPDVSEEG